MGGVMNPIKAQILRGDKVILDGIDVWLKVVNGLPQKRWSGHFDLVSSCPDLMTGQDFRIVLADGRTGMLLITYISTGSHSKTGVDFKGNGPLE